MRRFASRDVGRVRLRAAAWTAWWLAGAVAGGARPAVAEDGAAAVADPRPPLYVLTIGNSFSDDATRVLPEMAKEAKTRRLEIRRWAALGSHGLDRHAAYLAAWRADPNDPADRPYDVPETVSPDKKADLATILRAEPWDVVTIQQLSSSSPFADTYFPHAERLAEAVREFAPQAKLVVHETWPYRPDDPWLASMHGPENRRIIEPLHWRWKMDETFTDAPLADILAAIAKVGGFPVDLDPALVADAADAKYTFEAKGDLHGILDRLAGVADFAWTIRDGRLFATRETIFTHRPLAWSARASVPHLPAAGPVPPPPDAATDAPTEAAAVDAPWWRLPYAGRPEAGWEKMHAAIADNYRDLARRTGADLFPVGDAFAAALNDPAWGYASPPRRPTLAAVPHPEDLAPFNRGTLHIGYQMWPLDWSRPRDSGYQLRYDPRHAGAAGEYLGAAVWYECLLGESALDVDFRPKNLPEDQFLYLRELAHRTVAAHRAARQAERAASPAE